MTPVSQTKIEGLVFSHFPDFSIERLVEVMVKIKSSQFKKDLPDDKVREVKDLYSRIFVTAKPNTDAEPIANLKELIASLDAYIEKANDAVRASASYVNLFYLAKLQVYRDLLAYLLVNPVKFKGKTSLGQGDLVMAYNTAKSKGVLDMDAKAVTLLMKRIVKSAEASVMVKVEAKTQGFSVTLIPQRAEFSNKDWMRISGRIVINRTVKMTGARFVIVDGKPCARFILKAATAKANAKG